MTDADDIHAPAEPQVGQKQRLTEALARLIGRPACVILETEGQASYHYGKLVSIEALADG